LSDVSCSTNRHFSGKNAGTPVTGILPLFPGAIGLAFCIDVEAKTGRRFEPEVLKGLQAIGELSAVKRRILVGGDSWQTKDRIEVMSPSRFTAVLSSGL
jgi:hypothetical protein